MQDQLIQLTEEIQIRDQTLRNREDQLASFNRQIAGLNQQLSTLTQQLTSKDEQLSSSRQLQDRLNRLLTEKAIQEQQLREKT